MLDHQTGERHIADVYSEKDVVLEFQSYSIDPEEMRARENFYKKLVWIVNGRNNESDSFYFDEYLVGTTSGDPMLKNLKWFGRSKLLAKWSQSTKHVYLDFGSDIVWHLVAYDVTTKTGQVRAYAKAKFVHFFGGRITP